MSENEVCEKLVAATIQSVAKACEVLGYRVSVPHVVFNLRGITAGMAFSYVEGFTPLIRYNLGLAKENLEAFLDNTVPHEVAHIVANRHFGKNCGHKREWQWVMRKVYGIEPKRCHQYDVSAHRIRKTFIHIYKCGCGECRTGTKHHNLIQNAPDRRIICSVCRQVLKKENYIRSVERH